MTVCAIHTGQEWGQTPLPSLNASPSGFPAISRRIASRLSPSLQAAFLDALARFQAGIDISALQSAIASGNLSQIQSAAGSGRLQALLLGDRALYEGFEGIAAASGTASMDALNDLTDGGYEGIRGTFNARHPNVVLFARENAGNLAVGLSDEMREVVRIVTALGADMGLTVNQQAMAIREMLPLPSNWASAPLNLERELRNGTFTSSRRLSAADKARIRSALKTGDVTDDFIAEMRESYTKSLTNRRAMNIAHTESLRAANFGVNESWNQAAQQGTIPKQSRRMWIVTPDQRLQHYMVPGMNPNGRALGEMFETPEGPVPYPPSRTNCRCSIGLQFPAGTVPKRPPRTGTPRAPSPKATPKTPVPPTPPPEPPPPPAPPPFPANGFTDRASAQAWAKTRFPDTTFYALRKGTKLDQESINVILRQLDDLDRRFPNVFGDTIKKVTAKGPGSGPMRGNTFAFWSPSQGEMAFNTKYWGNHKLLRQHLDHCKAQGWMTSADPAAVVSHEFAHALEDVFPRLPDGSRMMMDPAIAARQAREQWMKARFVAEDYRTVSRYAATAYYELWAEAFAGWYHGALAADHIYVSGMLNHLRAYGFNP